MFITNWGVFTNCVVTCAAICNKYAQQFVINKVITNCGVITNCVVSCAAIWNKKCLLQIAALLQIAWWHSFHWLHRPLPYWSGSRFMVNSILCRFNLVNSHLLILGHIAPRTRTSHKSIRHSGFLSCVAVSLVSMWLVVLADYRSIHNFFKPKRIIYLDI